ncbi:peptide chain release factor 1 [Buchnera aphidicola]|uniref:peptide chain release factor 1 n=1 Tax=Buchnera aphidicola TaxID=9 RepID=UPI003463A119
MNKSMIVKLQHLQDRYEELEVMLSEVNLISNPDKFCALSKEYLKLSEISRCFIDWKKSQKEIESIMLLLSDNEMRILAEEELFLVKQRAEVLDKKLKKLLLPNDPYDVHSCFIEIRAATGGDEAAIFAGDLLRMYIRYAEIQSWRSEVISTSESEKGGFKEIIAKIKGKGACGRLKFESGGHRVQRIPKTESQGRIHTSTCTVAVMPEVLTLKKVIIRPSDLKIDTFRSSGAGGQHVNTTDSAIRITHLPTGHVVECQDERSQHKNKAKALSVLSARIHAAEETKLHEKNSLIRRNLLGSGERSDRTRTYNFPQNRVTDHRINLTVYSLDEILQGHLDLIINPIIQEHQAELLASLSDKYHEYS